MALDRPRWAPPDIDLDRPNAARVYDYLLGGACNFEPDRQFAKQLLQIMPSTADIAKQNRAFLRRAVRFCLDAGIRQFVDIGSGIPTVGNVHEIAQGIDPESRVLYVDNEPVAVAHSELILEGNERAAALRADLADPNAVLDSEVTRGLLDFDEPVAVLMVAVLHFVPDSARPQDAVTQYVHAMAPGSFLVLSHGYTPPEQRDQATEDAEKLYHQRRHATQLALRGREEIAAFFSGTELVPPGMVWTSEWRPEPHEIVSSSTESRILAGVGRTSS